MNINNEALDRWITGNYGEDSCGPDECPDCDGALDAEGRCVDCGRLVK